MLGDLHSSHDRPTQRTRPQRIAPTQRIGALPRIGELQRTSDLPRIGDLRRMDDLQRVVGNRAATRVLARKVKLVGNRLERDDRMGFDKALELAMPVQDGQHRAHVIAYDTITRGVMDPINLCVRENDKKWLNAVFNLIRAVFPNEGTSTRHPPLSPLANDYYQKALAAYKEIEDALKGPPAPALSEAANKLIYALNNSPDNLRPGAGGTNSSIKEGLDLEPLRSPDNVEVLSAGTAIVDQRFPDGRFTTTNLPKETLVLRVNKLDESMVWQMLTFTWSERNELHLYSSGTKLQSSDYKNMKSGTMTNQHPTKVAIEVPGHARVFFLFDFDL